MERKNQIYRQRGEIWQHPNLICNLNPLGALLIVYQHWSKSEKDFFLWAVCPDRSWVVVPPFPDHWKTWLIKGRGRKINNLLTACTVQLQSPHKQHGCWQCARGAFQTARAWLIGELLRHRAGDGPLQTGSPTLRNGGTYFVWLKEDDGWSANRLSARHHYDLPSVHFPASTPTPPLPPSPPDHDVMAHDIISSGTPNLPFPFFATQWTFIKSDRITSGEGCTGTGLGHTQWVGKCGKGGLLGGWWGGGKFSSFNLD